VFAVLNAWAGLLALPWGDPAAALACANRLAEQRQEPAAAWLYEQVAAASRPARAAFWMNLGKLQERAGNDLAALYAYRMVPEYTDLPSAEWWWNLQAVRQRQAPPAGASMPLLGSLRLRLTAWALGSVWPFLILFVMVGTVALPAFILREALPARLQAWPMRLMLAFGLLLIGWSLLMIVGAPAELRARAGAWLIVKQAVPLRAGNGVSYPALRRAGEPEVLRPGTEGWLTARRPNGWLRIELDDGRAGWLPASAVVPGP
jgi:hypothetical protein